MSLKWLKTKRFIIPTILVIIVAGILVRSELLSKDSEDPLKNVKAVEVIPVTKQDTISSELSLKGPIIPKEYTRIRSLVQASVQFVLPVGSHVKRGDQVVVLTDQEIEDSYFAALRAVSEANNNLSQTQSLNIESLNQAELSRASVQSSYKLAKQNLKSVELINEQNILSSEDSARIAYQSSYNLIEDVMRVWSDGTLLDFVLEGTPNANTQLLAEGVREFDDIKEVFQSTPSQPSTDGAMSIALLEPVMDQTKDFNDLTLRILNYSIADSAKAFSREVINGHKAQATLFVNQLNTSNASLRNARNQRVTIKLSNDAALLAAQNQLTQARIARDNADASLESTKRQIEIREIGAKTQLLNAKTQLAQAQSRYDSLFLTAPFGGVIIADRISRGDQVSPGQDLVEMGEVTAVEIELTIDEENSRLIALNQPAVINESITGSISEISPAASLKTGKVNIVVEADNTNQALIAGDIAEVMLTITVVKPESIVLPLSVITVSANETSVLVVEDNNVAKRLIELGQVLDGQVVIERGLEEGDKVIIKNSEFLDIGEEIMVVN